MSKQVVKTCWECGKEFVPYQGWVSSSHFCSIECSNKYWQREMETGVFHCRCCGKAFKATKKEKKRYFNNTSMPYCSMKCRGVMMGRSMTEAHKDIKHAGRRRKE